MPAALCCSTTTSVAPKCDIPKYISFIAKGYFVAEDARSCQAWFDATGSADETQRRFASNVTGNTFASTAWTFEGKIVWVDGMYGDQDAKGSVKFVTQFGERTVDPEEKKAATAKPAPAAKKVATAQAAPAEVSVASFQPIDTHHSEHGYEYGSESYELPKVYKRRANHTSDAYYEEEEHLEFVKGGSLHFTIWTKKY